MEIYKYGFNRYVKVILVLGMLAGAFYFSYINSLLNYETVSLFILVIIIFLILSWWQLSSKIILREGVITIKCFRMNIKEMEISKTKFKTNGYEDPNSYRSLTNKIEPYYSVIAIDRSSNEIFEIKIYDKKDYLAFSNILQRVTVLS
ncbi:hypothetical protein [Enterococcus sp. UD-01]|jgi:hypothetical protein|uniref:hypothetical protein n=1 Tax=Enterococcus sp. UD-01 TaxID=3373911 RepID=UPI0038388BF4